MASRVGPEILPGVGLKVGPWFRTGPRPGSWPRPLPHGTHPHEGDVHVPLLQLAGEPGHGPPLKGLPGGRKEEGQSQQVSRQPRKEEEKSRREEGGPVQERRGRGLAPGGAGLEFGEGPGAGPAEEPSAQEGGEEYLEKDGRASPPADPLNEKEDLHEGSQEKETAEAGEHHGGAGVPMGRGEGYS